jgi:hypothetical protein
VRATQQRASKIVSNVYAIDSPPFTPNLDPVGTDVLTTQRQQFTKPRKALKSGSAQQRDVCWRFRRNRFDLGFR